MYYLRAIVAYRGTGYFGWQAQSADTSCESRPTIEGTILNCLKTITNHQPCTISAASRTDGGVHAQGQVAKITLPVDISGEHLRLGLNSLLPADIRIVECKPSAKTYQPSRSCISKEYHYYFSIGSVHNVATGDIVQHLPMNNTKQDGIASLRSACKMFVGQHDFYNFSGGDKTDSSNIRKIFYCDIHKASFLPLADDIYYLKIIGDGFLKYMVRYLMGALYALAQGRITSDDIARYLQQPQPDKLSAKVKSKGLHLIHIEEQKK